MTISNTTRFELFTWTSGEDEFSRQQMTESHISLSEIGAIYLSGTGATPPTATEGNTKSFYWDSTNLKLYFRGDGTHSWQQMYPVLPGGHIHSDLQPITAELTALIGISGTGLTVRTAAATYAARTITVSGSGISISNGNAVSGNPAISLNSTKDNTPSTIVFRDADGNFAAGAITASLTGNADTATAWKTARALTVSGDASGVTSAFDGTGAISLSLSLTNTNLIALAAQTGTGLMARTGTATYAARSIAVSGTGLSISNADGISANPTISINATNANTASTVVARDADGNFTAATITAALTGNATTATTLASSRNFSISGDGSAPSISFNGSATVPLVFTLATVNSTTGSFGDSVTVPAITVNGKGLVTAVTATSIRTASTSTTGITQLTDSTSSTSTTTAATPNSVKSAYDLANAALARSGGTLTGKVTTVASGTTTASIVLSAGSTDPTSPVSGDVWNNAGTIKLYNGSATKTIAYIDGNVSTSTALQTARTFTFTGDVATTNSGSTAVTASFDGSSAPSFTLRVKNDSHTHDTQYYTETEVNAAKLYQYGSITAPGVDSSGTALLSGATRTTPRIYVQSNDPSAATGYVGVTGDIWFQI